MPSKIHRREMQKMGRCILNSSRLHALLSVLYQSILLELIQNSEICSLIQTSTFNRITQDPSLTGINTNISNSGKNQTQTTETKTILGFNLNMNSYVVTWQSTAVRQLLWSKVMKETGAIQIQQTPRTAGANSSLII